jgi:hypothetical protein
MRIYFKKALSDEMFNDNAQPFLKFETASNLLVGQGRSDQIAAECRCPKDCISPPEAAAISPDSITMLS